MLITLSLVSRAPPGHLTHASKTCTCSQIHTAERLRLQDKTRHLLTVHEGHIMSALQPQVQGLQCHPRDRTGWILMLVVHTCRILNRVTWSETVSVASNRQRAVASATACMTSSWPLADSPAQVCKGVRGDPCGHVQHSQVKVEVRSSCCQQGERCLPGSSAAIAAGT